MGFASFFAEYGVAIIFLTAGINLAIFVIVCLLARESEKKITLDSEKSFRDYFWKWLPLAYTVFLTITSIFPLLGMLGTVASLRILDVTGGGTEIQNHFFSALDTTICGIVFSVVFKVANAFAQNYIERQEERIEEMQKAKTTP